MNASLLLVTLVLHGPVDILTTALYWQLEANPIVIQLGVGAWIAIKIVALAALVTAWSIAKGNLATTVLLSILALLGVLLILPNIALVAMVA